MRNLKGHILQLNIIFIIKTSVLLTRMLGKCGTFRQQGTSLCVCHVLCWYWQRCNFLSCTWFHRTIGEYGQWITTQYVCKKILHVLHFKWIISIKYFLSYVKKCQTGTYFFGWVYYSQKFMTICRQRTTSQYVNSLSITATCNCWQFKYKEPWAPFHRMLPW